MPRPRKPEGTAHPDGYVRVTVGPAGAGKRVYLHRHVLYEALGPEEQECFWCGRLVDWSLSPPNPSALVVDHVDHDRRNNDLSNLVPSCQSCNLRRKKSRRDVD